MPYVVFTLCFLLKKKNSWNQIKVGKLSVALIDKPKSNKLYTLHVCIKLKKIAYHLSLKELVYKEYIKKV